METFFSAGCPRPVEILYFRLILGIHKASFIAVLEISLGRWEDGHLLFTPSEEREGEGWLPGGTGTGSNAESRRWRAAEAVTRSHQPCPPSN